VARTRNKGRTRHLKPTELGIDRGNYTATAIASVNARIAEIDKGAIWLKLVNFEWPLRCTINAQKKLSAIFGTDDTDYWYGQLLYLGWDQGTDSKTGIVFPYFIYLPLIPDPSGIPWDFEPEPLAWEEVRHWREKLDLGLILTKEKKMPELSTLGIDTGKHLKASDLQGREVQAVIQTATVEKLGDEPKLVLGFVGKAKGLVLNKGNTNVLVEAFGSNTDRWIGQTVVLFSVMTEYQGKPVQGLRLKAAPAAPAPVNYPVEGPDFDDEIPF